MIMERCDVDVGGDESKGGEERTPIIIYQQHTLTVLHTSTLLDLIEEIFIPRVPGPERVEGHLRRSIQQESTLGAIKPNLCGAPCGSARSPAMTRSQGMGSRTETCNPS